MIVLTSAQKKQIVKEAKYRLVQLEIGKNESNNLLESDIKRCIEAVRDDESELAYLKLNNVLGLYQLRNVDLSSFFTAESVVFEPLIEALLRHTNELNVVTVE